MQKENHKNENILKKGVRGVESTVQYLLNLTMMEERGAELRGKCKTLGISVRS